MDLGAFSYVAVLFHGLGMGHRAISPRHGPYRRGHTAIAGLGSLKFLDGLWCALGVRIDGESSGRFSSSGVGALGDMAVAAPVRNRRQAGPRILAYLRCGNYALDRPQLHGVPQIHTISLEFRARTLAGE